MLQLGRDSSVLSVFIGISTASTLRPPHIHAGKLLFPHISSRLKRVQSPRQYNRRAPMDQTPPATSANRQIARVAGTVMVAIVAGQLLGLLRGILVARAFPAAELDAFFAANRVSETLFMLIAAGALGSAFIPTFMGLLAQGQREAAWRLASALANLILLILSALALLAAVFAPAIVKYLLAPGFSADPAALISRSSCCVCNWPPWSCSDWVAFWWAS